MDQKNPDPGEQTTPNTTPATEGRTVCAGCGKVANGTPLTWTCSVENGDRRYFCETCARAHLRAIESRLDSTWW